MPNPVAPERRYRHPVVGSHVRSVGARTITGDSSPASRIARLAPSTEALACSRSTQVSTMCASAAPAVSPAMSYSPSAVRLAPKALVRAGQVSGSRCSPPGGDGCRRTSAEEPDVGATMDALIRTARDRPAGSGGDCAAAHPLPPNRWRAYGKVGGGCPTRRRGAVGAVKQAEGRWTHRCSSARRYTFTE